MKPDPVISRWRASIASTDSASGALLAMAAMYFVVVCAVGILRPIKNALALDGLGATDFYKVYLVSAAVVLFVPLYNRFAERFSFRWIVPAVAAFFALNLVLFRVFYVAESAAFGLLFYGWYDLFAAALVTQFFIATQLFLDTRAAKRAYPLIIAGGSLGATLGGAITGFFAGVVGTPNLLLVAAALIVAFSLGMPLVLAAGPTHEESAPARRPDPGEPKLSTGELRNVFSNRHVQLIAATVLMTIVVKQLIDYQFNAITKEVFDTRDAISAFQGKFNAATQWLPIVALAMLRPGLRRWGVGAAVLVTPLVMFGAGAALIAFWGLWAVVGAKGAETAFRYSTERTGREILYVPVPEDIKLKAKAYIDVAVEKGVGKVFSAVLILILVQFMDFREIAYVVALACLIWLGLALAVHGEYVRTLASSIEGRFASLRGGFASLLDASTLPVIRRALGGDAPLQTAFALDLIDQSAPGDAAALAGEVNRLTEHPAQEIRERALNLLARFPAAADEGKLRHRLRDPVSAVREAAVRALAARRAGDAGLVRELIASEEPAIRTAVLACLGRREIGDGYAATLGEWYLSRRSDGATDTASRLEMALAVGAIRERASTERYIEPLLDDPDPQVRSAALRSAGALIYVPAYQRMIAALATPATRDAAREALIQQGAPIVPYLSAFLHDGEVDPAIRRSIPSVLAAIVDQQSVDALLDSILAPQTDQLLDHRALKALSKLRVRGPRLRFGREEVLEVALRHDQEARVYGTSLAALRPLEHARPVARLLCGALRDAIEERREGVFRCFGLLHDPRGAYRAYLAITRGAPPVRANALEWLERTIGHELFERLSALIEHPAVSEAHPAAEPRVVLERLAGDGDGWIASCARALTADLASDRAPPSPDTEATVHLVEKVFMLQEVDLLRGAGSADLALLATIAQETEAPAGTVLVAKGEPPSALFIIRRGSVELHGAGDPIVLGPGNAVGTWALIDEAASPVDATVVEQTHLLRVTRDEFRDLLADNPELAFGLLQGLARRMRQLVA